MNTGCTAVSELLCTRGTPVTGHIGASIENRVDPETWSLRDHREQEVVDSSWWPGTRKELPVVAPSQGLGLSRRTSRWSGHLPVTFQLRKKALGPRLSETPASELTFEYYCNVATSAQASVLLIRNYL